MAEYIEREALIEKLEILSSDLRFIVKYEKRHGSVSDVEKSKAKLQTMKEIISLVNSQPTADVEEVKHGKWYDGRCTCCGWEFPDRCSYYGYDDESFERTPCCPNCGAKMDKG